MPWQTPTIQELRQLNQSQIVGQLCTLQPTSPMIPNSVLRVVADANAGLAYLTLLYLNWLALQLMPDTAEKEWLDRHGDIWLINADSTTGRKLPSYSSGTVTATGVPGSTLLSGTILSAIVNTAGDTMSFQTTADVLLGTAPASVPVVAMTPGSAGNLDLGSIMTLTGSIAGVDSNLVVVSLTGGADEETDDELRARVLQRIQEPPMGGDADDYRKWALEVAGVTRVWVSPQEMGIGTVTVRFMMDDVRATTDSMTNGFPQSTDCDAVANFINIVRPVTVKDLFVEAPIPFPINFTIQNLSGTASYQDIMESVSEMLFNKSTPAYSVNGQLVPPSTIYAAWVSDAILNTPGVVSFDLVMEDQVPPYNGSLSVLGTVTFI